jgi:hypothetical protein
MGYGMKYTKGGFPFKASPAKQSEKLPLDANGNERKMPLNPAKEQAYENAQNDYDTANPTKAQLLAAHKKMDKDSPAPFKPKGMTGLTKQQKKNKRDKFSSDVKSFVTGKKKALELKQGEHNSKEFQAKVEKDIELRDEGRTLPQYTRKKR